MITEEQPSFVNNESKEAKRETSNTGKWKYPDLVGSDQKMMFERGGNKD